MTPLSENAKKKFDAFNEKNYPNNSEGFPNPARTMSLEILRYGYHTAYTELQAELTRLKKEVEELRQQRENADWAVFESHKNKNA